MAELESLFLLELLVDCVSFTTPEVSNLKETCVRFQFLQFPPFDVCEEDFAPNANGYQPSDVPFNGGKSILFSMSEYKAGNSINLDVTIMRSNENGEKIEIGKTVVPLGSSFTNLFNITNKQPLAEPVAKTIRDSYNFSNDKNAITGRVSILVRLSCFGCAIVTQFEVTDPEQPSFKFKNEEYKATSNAYIKVNPGKTTISAPPGIASPGMAPPGIAQDGGQEFGDPQNYDCGCGQQYYPPYNAPPPYQNVPPPAYFRPPVYAPPPPNIFPYPDQCCGGQYSPNMGYPQYPYPMFNPQFVPYQTDERRPQQYQEIPQMPKNALMCTCDNTKNRPQSPQSPQSPTTAFRRCYILGEGNGPLPRTGDIFSWNMPAKTEKDKLREELLGGPNITWEITPTQMMKKGDLIRIEVPTKVPKKSKPDKADGKKKLGMRGRGKDKLAKIADKKKGTADKKKKKGKGKVSKKVGVSIKRTDKEEIKKTEVNTFKTDELRENRILSEERIGEMRALEN